MAIVVFALVLSLVNLVLKPVLQALSMPITFLTLGLFYVVVNALLLELAANVSFGLFGAGLIVS